MKKTEKKEPWDPSRTPRFSGIKSFMRLPHGSNLSGIDFAVAGVPCDSGASYRTGQRFAPEAIRDISALLRPHNPVHDVTPLRHCRGIDYGDLPVVPGYLEESFARISAGLSPLVRKGVFPILLGGDHSITLPELRVMAKAHGPLALIQFDAHTDTADAYLGQPHNHGTPFRRAVEENLLLPARSVQIGMRGSLFLQESLDHARKLGFEVVPAREIREMGLSGVIDRIHARVGDVPAFMTFDVDFLDPAYAPGTGTPEVGGFTSYEAIHLVQSLAGINLVGCDIVEVLPSFDYGQITALLAANIAFEVISLIAVQKRG